MGDRVVPMGCGCPIVGYRRNIHHGGTEARRPGKRSWKQKENWRCSKRPLLFRRVFAHCVDSLSVSTTVCWRKGSHSLLFLNPQQSKKAKAPALTIKSSAQHTEHFATTDGLSISSISIPLSSVPPCLLCRIISSHIFQNPRSCDTANHVQPAIRSSMLDNIEITLPYREERIILSDDFSAKTQPVSFHRDLRNDSIASHFPRTINSSFNVFVKLIVLNWFETLSSVFWCKHVFFITKDTCSYLSFETNMPHSDSKQSHDRHHRYLLVLWVAFHNAIVGWRFNTSTSDM